MDTETTPDIEVPEPSYWPILLAFSTALIATGIIFSLILSAVGIAGLLFSIAGWTLENRHPLRQVEATHD